MDLLKDVFVSRKAKAAFLILLIVVLGEAVGLDGDRVELAVEGLMVFILGRAIHDHSIKGK